MNDITMNQLSQRQKEIDTLQQNLKNYLNNFVTSLPYHVEFINYDWFGCEGIYMPILEFPDKYKLIGFDACRVTWSDIKGFYCIKDENNDTITIRFQAHSVTSAIIHNDSLKVTLKKGVLCSNFEFFFKIGEKEYVIERIFDNTKFLNNVLSKPLKSLRKVKTNMQFAESKDNAQKEFESFLQKAIGEDETIKSISICDQKQRDFFQISDQYMGYITPKKTNKYFTETARFENDELSVWFELTCSEVNVDLFVVNKYDYYEEIAFNEFYEMALSWKEQKFELKDELTALEIVENQDKL